MLAENNLEQKAMKELTEQQKQAKLLIEANGFEQKEVAKTIGVSEKTIGTWILKFGWIKTTPLAMKKRIVHQLIVFQNVSQKEAAKIANVSEKSVSTWAIIGKWKEEKTLREAKQPDLFEGFKQYVMVIAPKQFERINSLINGYMNIGSTEPNSP